jgi:HAD superfamily 5'-nucleotidase-like hydrolase
MDRTRLFELKRQDLPDLVERSDEVAPMDARRKIFCNRNLRLDKIEVIGFDMDYTLAIYKKVRIEELAFRLTVEKLIEKRGYPPAIREVRYEPDRVIRGLVIDKRRGNIFKMDRYGHIGRVRHGAEDLPKDERIKLYRTRKVELDPFGYGWVDTLFALPEACLYSQLVDFFDGCGGAAGGGPKNGGNGAHPPEVRPSYRQLYQDVRECIDEAHADDSIKSVIRANPAEYIEREPELAFALHRFRSSGKRLFLLTNSAWDYTDAVMRYLFDGALEGYPSWRNYFDIVIVSARKPVFFVKREPFRRVDEAGGAADPAEVVSLDRGKIYAGGNLRDFERLGQMGGERILYVGDHIYGDILRSKKSSLWRTAMIIPELEDVVWHQQLFAQDMTRSNELEEEMRRIDYEINYYKLLLSSVARLKEQNSAELAAEEDEAIRAATQQARDALDRLKGQLRTLVAEHQEIERRIETSANRYWGLLFAEGSETSLFGKQVEDYACIYTSRVSNFLYYSPVQYFRSPPHLMPHELTR